MKKCVVYGDMQADSAADQYPTVNLCDDCVEEDQKAGENARIVTVEGAGDPDLGDSCEWCGAEASEEHSA